MKRTKILAGVAILVCLVVATSTRAGMAAGHSMDESVHPRTTTGTPPRTIGPPKFLFIGDSLTTGLFASEEATTFRALLTVRFGATATTVAGSGGDSADFLASEASIIAAEPDVVVIELGTNDEVDGRYTTDDLAANLSSLVGFALQGNPACRVVMLSTWRATGQFPEWDAVVEDVADDCGAPYVSLQAIFDAADNRGPAGLPTIWPGIPGPGGIGWVTDHFHPNDAGHAAIAAAVASVLEDETAPETTDDAPAAWRAGDTTVTLTAHDAGSGVDYVEYKVDDGAWTSGDQVYVSAPADHSNDGIHVVSYRAVDVALNTETARTCRVKLDTRRPTTKAPHSETTTRGRYVKLHYRVDDLLPNAGTASVTIRIRTFGGRTVKKAVFSRRPVNSLRYWRFRCTLAQGSYRFFVHATDAAGNKQSKVGSNRLFVK